MASVAKVCKFSFSELCVLAEAWFVFLKWDLLISFTQYEYWRKELYGLHNINDAAITTELATFERVKAIIALSEKAGRFHIRKMNCLRRCISQEKMLEKRGFKTRMHIGVRFENEKLIAHAWLTLHGKVINDSEDVSTRYSELKANNQQTILKTLK